MPTFSYVQQNVVIDATHVAQYRDICGFPVQSNDVPLTYPYLLIFPLQALLLIDDAFPFQAMGVVHLANRIRQFRPLLVGSTVTVSVRFDQQVVPHEKGNCFTVVSELLVDGKSAWRCDSTYLFRMKVKDRSPDTVLYESQIKQEDVSGLSPLKDWTLRADFGRKYAAVSGDFNPIHLYGFTAKLFGFPHGCIMHGMWSKAAAVACILEKTAFSSQSSDKPIAEVYVEFKLPLYLPGKPSLSVSPQPLEASKLLSVAHRTLSHPHSKIFEMTFQNKKTKESAPHLRGYIVDENGQFLKSKVVKLLSEDPSNYKDAPTEGIRRILELELGIPHPRTIPVDTSHIESIRMGTTVATNALLERKGDRVAFITTKGFADIQRIGNQSRPKIFDLEIKRPELLYEKVFELNERIVLVREDSQLDFAVISPEDILECVSHEKAVVECHLDEAEVERVLREVLSQGIESVAVALLHSYAFPQHEKIVKRIASRLGVPQISLSSEVMPMVRFVPRGCTACVDAYLTPVIRRYLHSFLSGFDDQISSRVQVTFMQSDGGLAPMQAFLGNRAILSGPAGGVVGYAMTSYPRDQVPAIGFDMGGTSTDVSRYAGVFEHVFESTTAGVTIQSPQLDINTVAAGGGSRLFYKNKLFVVGPESAGAHPGPICYRKGGYLAVTDANVLLGRVQPHLFPNIFGPNENECLDSQATRNAFQVLAQQINAQTDSPYSIDEIALGFVRVANEAMARPIRNLTTMKGYDVTTHSLACFGGAGPQHCCAIARSLGIKKIHVHKHAGILSAYGLSLADVVVEKQEPFSGCKLQENFLSALESLSRLQAQASQELTQQGFTVERISSLFFLNCRYRGTDTSLMTSLPHQALAQALPSLSSSTFSTESIDPLVLSELVQAYQNEFVRNYRREFGFELTGRDVLVDDVRIRATGASFASLPPETSLSLPQPSLPTPSEHVSVYFEEIGRVSTPVYLSSSLLPLQAISGPALIIQNVATVVVEPGWEARISSQQDIEIFDLQGVEDGGSRVPKRRVGTALDPIYLSVFSHRFMGIAEQMGRTLQRTSVSVNIKERLDFSCALFDREGGLVANAPHLPVHLGAMSEAVRAQVRYWNSGDRGGLKEGDVLVSNHPQLAGGSHLPDITVITPIFDSGKLEFFVASRGHHSDVGGIAPGSMPPLSKCLEDEGAAIQAFKLVEGQGEGRAGVFQEEGISQLLMAPASIPGNSGARNLQDNLSDLRAQVAANQRGAQLMKELIGEYGLDVVSAYMNHIQTCADRAVREMLKSFSEQEGMSEVDRVSCTDYLDDGSPIALSIEIDRTKGTALFDFEGTGFEMIGNLNAPPAVCSSAIIYSLRCLLKGIDLPLNQGVLAPITIRIPPSCLLNPSPRAAVVGGNVLTSQRVTDVILKAFKACADSQGCMNNLTFGDSQGGYYETIAGGAGAGPGWDGCSGVHTHMTNTRITDPEILELRYPVLLRTFGLRKGSGGEGRWKGGEGVIREIEFRKPLVVSILSERRSFAPRGLLGGKEGQRGLNLLSILEEGGRRTVNLGGKSTVYVRSGDRLSILSPGGGGFGQTDEHDPSPSPSLPPAPPAMEDVSALRALMGSGSLGQYVLNQETV